MCKRKAFTLVELLVVIAIIALLMSILMPALGRVRKQAKDLICLSNLRQWAIIFRMYADDYEGSTISSLAIPGAEAWVTKMFRYYKEDKLLLCPMATRPWYNPEQIGRKHMAWVIPAGATEIPEWETKDAIGSYGINDWVWNAPPGEENPSWGVFEIENCWRTFDVKRPDTIPLLSDAIYLGHGPGTRGSGIEPPQIEDMPHSGDWIGFGRICINRHGTGTINVLFMDFSARSVGLKELWTLKWHKRFNAQNAWTIAGGATLSKWADHGTGWMKKFEDY